MNEQHSNAPVDVSPALVLNRAQTRAALDPVKVMTAVTAALIAISRDEVSAPPRIAARSVEGLLGAMPAWVPGIGLAAKLVSVFPGHGAHEGVVALFDDQTGGLLALMSASEITAVRTAAVATLSMRALAADHPSRIVVVGSGVQARAQVAMLAAFDSTVPVVVTGRSRSRAERAAAVHPLGTVGMVEEAVRGADVVFCCTGSNLPVIRRSWLAQGVHVSSIGGSHGPELDAATINDGSLFVEWPGAFASPPPAGAHELQGLAQGRANLLGSVLAGNHPGRTRSSELTVFKSTGHAALDVAAASVIYAFALEQEVGVPIDL
jgi:ornithine cyclodeaminase/alanine dehydrogenase-like protein (mu-crystallin family)